jgi:hypothetical protein
MNVRLVAALFTGLMLFELFVADVEAASPTLTVLAPKKKKKKPTAPAPKPKEQKGGHKLQPA